MFSSISVIYHNIFKASSLNLKIGSIRGKNEQLKKIRKKHIKIAITYQATIMNEFVFDDKSCTANQLIDARVFDDRNKIITTVLHFMKATCKYYYYYYRKLNFCSVVSLHQTIFISIKVYLLKKSWRETLPTLVNCDSSCKNPRS